MSRDLKGRTAMVTGGASGIGRACVEAAVGTVERDVGPIGVLVTCAEVLQRTLPPPDLSWKEWDLVPRIHLRGT